MSTDLFGNEDKPQRARSGREKENDDKISYHKYTGAKSIACWDCTNEPHGIRMASVIRREGGTASYICARHAQTRRDAEALRELATKNTAKHQANAKRRRA